MHGYYWGERGIPRTGRFACFNYIDSPLGFWLMITFMVLLLAAIVLLVISARRKHSNSLGESEAMTILKRRYANGELTGEEFEKMKRVLR